MIDDATWTMEELNSYGGRTSTIVEGRSPRRAPEASRRRYVS
jgi:hypothetical protein